MQVEGRCHCGEISFTAEIDPDRVMLCHCTDCQVLSGSPFREIAVAPIESFVLRGHPKRYVKVAASGNRRAQVFCPTCATPLYSAAPENPASVTIRLGCVEQRRALRPSAQVWAHSAMPWVDADDLLPNAVAKVTDANPSVDEMEARVARFRSLRATDDYRDAAIPGCERTTFRVLGTRPAAPLAAEGFHLNIVRCEPGRAAPLHSHVTQEVFVALTGRWEVFWGPTGERSVTLEPWDTISVPPGLSRGFRNVAAEPAYLIGMASGRDPGRIDWPASVRAAALAVGVDLG